MALGMGYEGWLGMVSEAAWGTEVNRTKFLELLRGGDGLDITEEPLLSESVYNAGYDTITDFAQGSISAGGPISFEVPVEGAEVMLLHALGAVATTQPDVTSNPTVYQHIFTMVDQLDDGIGMSLEVNRDAASFVYTGCKVASIEFSTALNSFLKCNVGIIAKDGEVEGSPSTFVAPDKAPFTFVQGVLNWGGSPLSVVEATIALNNNLSADRRFIGSRYISEPVRAGKAECTYSIVVEFDSTTQYTDFRAATSRALQLKFTGATITGAYAYDLQLDLALARHMHAMPLISDEGRITYQIVGRAFRNDSNNELKATLVNTITSVA